MIRPRVVALVVVATTFLVVPATVVAADTQLPFNDPNVSGQLGFCDKANHPITSGNIGDVPFVWKAVSTVAAPKAYVGPEGKATLFAYSPIKNVSPGQWSPYQLTSSAYYSNSKHPMVQATYADAPLEFQTTGFPPTLDGLVQIRMLFSAPNRVPLTSPYPAAVLRVNGDQWTLVSGDRTPDCGAGKSVSVATVRMPNQQPTAPPKWAANSPAKAKPTPVPGSTPAASGGAAPSPAVTSSDGSSNGTASTSATQESDSTPVAAGEMGSSAPRESGGGVSPMLAVLLVALGIVVAGVVGVLVGRRSKPEAGQK